MLVRAVSVCLVWLVMVSARPSGHRRGQPMDGHPGVQREVGATDRVLGAGHREVREAAPPTDTQAQRAWDKFVDFVQKQKSTPGRSGSGSGSGGRSRKGTPKGCFRMRMDRIGSMSKLGC
ncbi:uncharacterized protein LOC144609682 [Rhinoraja longicauda]